MDWDHWRGQPVASTQAADQAVSTPLVNPDGLPAPRSINVLNSVDVAFVYDLDTYGRVVVLEGPPDSAPGHLAQTYREQASHSCGRSKAVTIRNGTPAVAHESGEWAAIEWVESKTQMSIQMRTGTRDQAIVLANAL